MSSACFPQLWSVFRVVKTTLRLSKLFETHLSHIITFYEMMLIKKVIVQDSNILLWDWGGSSVKEQVILSYDGFNKTNRTRNSLHNLPKHSTEFCWIHLISFCCVLLTMCTRPANAAARLKKQANYYKLRWAARLSDVCQTCKDDSAKIINTCEMVSY